MHPSVARKEVNASKLRCDRKRQDEPEHHQRSSGNISPKFESKQTSKQTKNNQMIVAYTRVVERVVVDYISITITIGWMDGFSYDSSL